MMKLDFTAACCVHSFDVFQQLLLLARPFCLSFAHIASAATIVIYLLLTLSNSSHAGGALSLGWSCVRVSSSYVEQAHMTSSFAISLRPVS